MPRHVNSFMKYYLYRNEIKLQAFRFCNNCKNKALFYISNVTDLKDYWNSHLQNEHSLKSQKINNTL